MRAPRLPNSNCRFDASLFSPEEIFGLSKEVKPSLEYARAQAIAWELHSTFLYALDFEHPPGVKTRHYSPRCCRSRTTDVILRLN
jgi:hypothetical protein